MTGSSLARALCALAWLSAALCATAAEQLQIDAEDHGGGRFRVRATLPDVGDPAQAQGLLAPAFAQLCQGARVTLGHYSFDAVAPLAGRGAARLTLVQDVQCGDAAPLLGGSRPVPTARDEEVVRAHMLAYLKARDAGDRVTAGAFYSNEVTAVRPDDKRSTQGPAFLEVAGEPGPPRLFEPDWQDDPTGVPAGRYVAVDYLVQYASGALSCGYVGWRQTGADSYEIVRLEEGQLTRELLDRMSPAERDEAYRRIGCRN